MKNHKKILVVGESCYDIFVYCNSLRLAPDIPVPILEIVEETENPGMAKNVERNVKALYKLCDIVTNTNWRKVTKIRYMHHRTNQGFFRVDADHTMKRINVRQLPLKKYDIIAISDYNKGFLTKEDMQYICEHHDCVFVDTKKPVGAFLRRAKFIKINAYEYDRSWPIAKDIARKIICTKGEHGANFKGKMYPVERIETKDSSGAGDSFFAALLVRYAETGNIEDAIRFANICTTQVVQQRGVSVIHKPTLSEINKK
ncbi:MAG: PfkB family carbohydrate kinase [bacterium]|nr:PfkB family carbohydrate kinase [bacterium]